MKSFWKRVLCLLMLSALLLAGALPAFAEGEESESLPDEAVEPELPVYQDIPIYADGLLIGRGQVCEGIGFIALERFCAYLGMDCETSLDETSGVLRMHAYGFTLEADPAKEYFTVNNRYVYDPVGFRMIGGQPYFTAEAVGHIFHITAQLSEDGSILAMDLSELEILSGGVTYYSDTYGSDNIFWLSRVICAEAGSQTMDGLIGVGNVVLNRVASEHYPDNIYAVIFDPGQFEPTLDGHIYREPNEESVVAACLCLDGYNTAGNSLFFIDPRYADDSWMKFSKTYVATLGLHDFYA